jgi:AcrR family transcriptional regulator
MTDHTKDAISSATKRIFAEYGYDGLTMRRLAQEAGVSLSVTYYHYKDKDALLKQVFKRTAKQLGQLRAALPHRSTAGEMLHDRIAFQVEHALDIVFILKYYLHFRLNYPHNANGYLPTKAYLHITEVLERGIASGEFELHNTVAKEAKIVAHAINGFLLEYYPMSPDTDEQEELISSIHDFVMRALAGGTRAKA